MAEQLTDPKLWQIAGKVSDCSGVGIELGLDHRHDILAIKHECHQHPSDASFQILQVDTF